MKKYFLYGSNNRIKIASTTKFDVISKDETILEKSHEFNPHQRDNSKNIKLAYICNWNQACGISTYSKIIFDELKSELNEYKIFSEYPQTDLNFTNTDDITYCWKRGQNLGNLLSKIKEYKPNFILIQHEWGIFPNAGYFMSFIMNLKRLEIPFAVIIHSVYTHLDKLIPLSVIDNVIVHSNDAKQQLEKLKFNGNVFVIPHGCPEIKTYEEVWYIFQTPYLIFGYGFGFKYKGVEIAIDAIKHLKESDPKFKNILYIYACSESETNKGIHQNYYDILSTKVEKEGLQDNVILLKGFLEPEMLDIYLKTVKMVIFPYVIDSTNGVFGSSGAIKIAMSYNIPVIASKSHLFDDIDGYAIRISDYKELANEIDKLFSNNSYRNKTIEKAHEYIKNNTWKISAQKYIDSINIIRKQN